MKSNTQKFKIGDKVKLAGAADTDLFAERGIMPDTIYTVKEMKSDYIVTLKKHETFWIHEKWLVPAETEQ